MPVNMIQVVYLWNASVVKYARDRYPHLSPKNQDNEIHSASFSRIQLNLLNAIMSFFLSNFVLFHSPCRCKFGTDIAEVKKTAFLKQSFTRLNEKQTENSRFKQAFENASFSDSSGAVC